MWPWFLGLFVAGNLLTLSDTSLAAFWTGSTGAQVYGPLASNSPLSPWVPSSEQAQLDILTFP